MTTSATLPWNLVIKNLHGNELLQKKLREKITKLEKHLKHFPPDTVHLQIVLERHPKKPLHTATLTLRVPSNILHSEKSATDVIKAFDDAVDALLRKLESLKSELRRETFWKRKERRKQLHERKAASFATEGMADGTGPQKPADLIREFLQQHYSRLVRHVRRQIRHDELTGDLPKDALNPRDIVDDVARQVLARAGEKPPKMSWIVWLYHLIHEELHRQRDVFKHKRVEEISIDETKTLPEDAEKAAGYDVLRPLDIVAQELEPPVVRTEALVPDLHAVPPDQIVAQKDLLEYFQGAVQNWPRPERDVFELYFVEGFEPDEIAMVTGQSLRKVQENLASVQRRLREAMLEEAVV